MSEETDKERVERAVKELHALGKGSALGTEGESTEDQLAHAIQELRSLREELVKILPRIESLDVRSDIRTIAGLDRRWKITLSFNINARSDLSQHDVNQIMRVCFDAPTLEGVLGYAPQLKLDSSRAPSLSVGSFD